MEPGSPCCASASSQSGHSSDNQQPYETDWKRLVARQKQIDYGKNTVGYQRYTAQVPRHRRRLYGKNMHPRTPDVTLKTSKRAWDGMVRAWRRHLHRYDPENLDSQSPNYTGLLPVAIPDDTLDSAGSHAGNGIDAVHMKGAHMSAPASQRHGKTSSTVTIATTVCDIAFDSPAYQACNAAGLFHTLQDAPSSNRMKSSATKPLDQTSSTHTPAASAHKTMLNRLPLANRTNQVGDQIEKQQRRFQLSKPSTANRKSDQSSKFQTVGPSLPVIPARDRHRHLASLNQDRPPVLYQTPSSLSHMQPQETAATSAAAATAHQLNMQGQVFIPLGANSQDRSGITYQSKSWQQPSVAPYRPPCMRLPAASASSTTMAWEDSIAHDVASAPTHSACASMVIGTDQLPSHLSCMIFCRFTVCCRGAAAVTTSTCANVRPTLKSAAAAYCLHETAPVNVCMVCGEEEGTVLLMPCKHRALCGDCSQQFIMAAGLPLEVMGSFHGNLGYCPACQQAVRQHIYCSKAVA